MNKRVKEFLDEKKCEEKEKFEEEKRKTLIELDLCDRVYAPMKGFGHLKGSDTRVTFPIKDKNAKIGDTVSVSINGENVDAVIDKIRCEKSYEFYLPVWDEINLMTKYYKKVPIEITDEEYLELKKYAKKEVKSASDNSANSVASVLKVIAWLVMICGFVAGIILGNVEVTKGTYYIYTTTEFSFAVAFTYWCGAFISGMIFLGFSESIQLLSDIKFEMLVTKKPSP